MQKWEYKTVRIVGDFVANIDGVDRNPRSLQITEVPFRTLFGEIGTEGWELVSVCPCGGNPSLFDCYFKRPKQ
jgi:hypothetical protein